MLVLCAPTVSADTAPTSPLESLFTQQPEACQPGLSAELLAPESELYRLYQAHQFSSLWNHSNRPTVLQEQLQTLLDDGLSPSYYPLPSEQISNTDCRDLMFSHAFLQALHDLAYGRIPRQKLQPLWRSENSQAQAPLDTVELASQALQAQGDLAQAFAQARPQDAHYQALRKHYAQRRQQPPLVWDSLPSGPLLKPNSQDPRIPALAKRLQAEGYLPASDTPQGLTYEPALVAAVQRYQAEHGLQDDGILGQQSLNALNLPPAQRLAQLQANLERWRWIASDLEPELVLVDIAGGYLSYWRDGQVQWRGRTQVGRRDRHTPELKSTLSRVTLNPTWTVPPTIFREDKLPKIRQDLGYLARNRMQVLDRDGTPLNPELVDWHAPGSIMLRQQAGGANPLGRLVLRFNNPFAVYLHDTPSQALFSKSPRDFSSGCVRVEGISDLLSQLLSPSELAKAQAKLETGQTHNQSFNRRIPILMAYWTADIDPEQRLILRNDIYAWDGPLIRALEKAN